MAVGSRGRREDAAQHQQRVARKQRKEARLREDDQADDGETARLNQPLNALGLQEPQKLINDLQTASDQYCERRSLVATRGEPELRNRSAADEVRLMPRPVPMARPVTNREDLGFTTR